MKTRLVAMARQHSGHGAPAPGSASRVANSSTCRLEHSSLQYQNGIEESRIKCVNHT